MALVDGVQMWRSVSARCDKRRIYHLGVGLRWPIGGYYLFVGAMLARQCTENVTKWSQTAWYWCPRGEQMWFWTIPLLKKTFVDLTFSSHICLIPIVEAKTVREENKVRRGLNPITGDPSGFTYKLGNSDLNATYRLLSRIYLYPCVLNIYVIRNLNGIPYSIQEQYKW